MSSTQHSLPSAKSLSYACRGLQRHLTQNERLQKGRLIVSKNVLSLLYPISPALKVSLRFSSHPLLPFPCPNHHPSQQQRGPLPSNTHVHILQMASGNCQKAFLPRGVLKAEHCVALSPNMSHFHQKSFKGCIAHRLWMSGLLDSILQSAQPWAEACPSWAGPHHLHQQFLVISEALVALKCLVQYKQDCLHDQSLPCTFS